MTTTTYQAVYELDDVARRILERHGDDWKSACGEAAEAYHHFRKVIINELKKTNPGIDWLQQVANDSFVRLVFVPPELRSPVTRELLQ